MAYFKFTDMLRKGETIRLFNYGNCKRDFTYVDDITEGILRVMGCAPERRQGTDGLPIAPHSVYNIGNSHPVNLLEFVDILHQELIGAGVLPADFDFGGHTVLAPMQAGDVPATYADTEPLEQDFGFKPATDLRTGSDGSRNGTRDSSTAGIKRRIRSVNDQSVFRADKLINQKRRGLT